MRRLTLLLIATAVALVVASPSVVHATHGSVGANYKFVIDGDNGGETPEQPAIQLKGTISVAQNATATAELTMLVSQEGTRTTYRSCAFPA